MNTYDPEGKRRGKRGRKGDREKAREEGREKGTGLVFRVGVSENDPCPLFPRLFPRLECYQDAGKVNDVAERRGRLPQSVFDSLRRIRRALYGCIARTLSQESRPECVS
jgi:hypothetical protein